MTSASFSFYTDQGEKTARAYHRKLLKGVADFGAVEAQALLNELAEISNMASKPDADPKKLATARSAAWGNVRKLQDALYNMANETDRMEVAS